MSLFSAESPEVQEEIEKLKERNRILDRGIQVAADAIAAGLRGEPTGLKGFPKADAPALEWHDYFIQEGALALIREGGS